jgi:hypothetical protein
MRETQVGEPGWRREKRLGRQKISPMPIPCRMNARLL